MKISEVIRITDEICPPELAEEWDNCGWQIKWGSKPHNNSPSTDFSGNQEH